MENRIKYSNIEFILITPKGYNYADFVVIISEQV